MVLFLHLVLSLPSYVNTALPEEEVGDKTAGSGTGAQGVLCVSGLLVPWWLEDQEIHVCIPTKCLLQNGIKHSYNPLLDGRILDDSIPSA